MRKHWLRHLALLAVVAMLAAACGDGGAGAPDETEPADAGATEPTETETAEATGAGDGTLTIGTILPETGSLAFLGPPEFAGVDLAAQDVNEAGGVLGNDIEVMQGDSGDTTTDIANQTVDRHLQAGADVIIGAASSAVSFTVIDKITGAGVVQFSPANTSPDFTDYDDNGLYFRTAPSDVLQGRTLGELIVEEGNSRVSIMALQDPYGEGLAENTQQAIEDSGGTVEPAPIIYDPQAQTFDAEVQQIVSADPDAIVVIGFDESSRILSTLIEQGVGPENKQIYLVDGNTSNALGEALPPGSLEGVKGTIPGAEATAEFQERLKEVDPDLKDFAYAPESYDAVIVSALAAIAADSDAGEALAQEIPGVTREGTKCTEFEECKQLLEDGEDIDYDGVSGPIEMSDAGDPQEATIGIYTFDAQNQLSAPDEAEYRSGSLEQTS